MTSSELLFDLLNAQNVEDASAALENYLEANGDRCTWTPFGRKNNRGTIEASGDTGRSLVERATNGIDAVLVLEHARHNGVPECTSPKQAAVAWLGVPDRGLSAMSAAQRRQLAQRVTIKLEPGEARNSRCVTVKDRGTGLSPAQMPTTILSLSEDNKLQKHYLAGTFGQGGSSTLAACRLCLIASRNDVHGPVGFTLAKYLDLPPEEYKTGHYVYLTEGNEVVQATGISAEDFPTGTVCKHFGYDLDSYPSPLGPNSVYGLLNMVLFDPVMPVWFENKVHNYNRVIKGSRNALNGAVDDGDENARGPTLAHSMPQFYVDLGDIGRIGIEYWVLEAATRQNKRPSAAFVNEKRPIVLTSNGQNHAELSVVHVRKEAELPFLSQRLICHVDCDRLQAAAKRALFVSNREEARRGTVRNQIAQELVRVLKSDDDLVRLNQEARDHTRRDQDEEAVKQIRKEVARLLHLQGFAQVSTGGGASGEGDGTAKPPRPPRPPRPLPPIESKEPPTYVRFVVDEGKVDIHPGQRRYLRIETDAPSSYFNSDPNRSRVQVMTLGLANISVVGMTALNAGRMRVGVVCSESALVGDAGVVRIELQRTGLPLLEDQCKTEVVAKPQSTEHDRKSSMPPFDIIRVTRDSDEWNTLDWPDDVGAVASSAEMSDGTLLIYYNAEFSPFAAKCADYEKRDVSVATSFENRYKIWLAMHSLLMYQDQQEMEKTIDADQPEASETQEEREESSEREERKRIANLAVMIATREIAMGAIQQADD